MPNVFQYAWEVGIVSLSQNHRAPFAGGRQEWWQREREELLQVRARVPWAQPFELTLHGLLLLSNFDFFELELCASLIGLWFYGCSWAGAWPAAGWFVAGSDRGPGKAAEKHDRLVTPALLRGTVCFSVPLLSKRSKRSRPSHSRSSTVVEATSWLTAAVG